MRSPPVSPLTFVGFWLKSHQQVLRRCYTTLNPLSAPTYTSTHLNPADLYGPFWTLTTLIFALYLSSSLGASIAAYLSAKGAEYDYDFQLLSVAVSLVYAYGLGVPVLLWLGLRYLGVGEWSVVEAISVWGYGQFVWIPVSVRTSSLFSWGAHLMISREGAMRHPRSHHAMDTRRNRTLSLRILPRSEHLPHPRFRAFLSHNATQNILMHPPQAEAKATRLIIILLAALQVGIALSFKILFFSYYVVDKIGGDIKIPGGDVPASGNSTVTPRL